jgi:hypothetical protein
MQELARLVLRAGLLDEAQLAEFRHWGLFEEDTSSIPKPTTAQQFIAQVEKALEDHDMVLVRETELEAIQQFVQGNKPGVLHLEVEGLSTTSESPIRFGKTLLGEYIFPWLGENMMDILVNGRTYLLLENGEKIFFCNCRKLFYGDIKAFIVCTPSPPVIEKAMGTSEATKESVDGLEKVGDGPAD